MRVSPLRVERDPPLAWVVLDRPDEGNPFEDALIHALRDTWVTLGTDPTVRAVGIAANGLALCPHNHLRRTLNSNAILPRCQRRAGGRISTAGEGSA